MIANPFMSPTAHNWDLLPVLDALLTRSKKGFKLGRMDFDPQANCFVVTDKVPALARMQYLLGVIENGTNSSDSKALVNASETSYVGHLKAGRIHDLLTHTHEALSKLKPGYAQRGVLRMPLLELKNEITRVDWDSPVQK